MPKLVSVSLFVGRSIRIEGVQHQVKRFEHNKTSVVLERDDGSGSLVSMPRSELYAQIVEETAELVDDTEDPELSASMQEINPNCLSIDRAIDRYYKMILLRHLLDYAEHSPRSGRFRRECERARRILNWVQTNNGILSQKTWSEKTLNDDLRRWRRAGYALAGFQVKGLQYRPWKQRATKYVRARAIAEQVRDENPAWTADGVKRMTQILLRKGDSARGMSHAQAHEKD